MLGNVCKDKKIVVALVAGKWILKTANEFSGVPIDDSRLAERMWGFPKWRIVARSTIKNKKRWDEVVQASPEVLEKFWGRGDLLERLQHDRNLKIVGIGLAQNEVSLVVVGRETAEQKAWSARIGLAIGELEAELVTLELGAYFKDMNDEVSEMCLSYEWSMDVASRKPTTSVDLWRDEVRIDQADFVD